jgi:hypothetical protein
VKGTIRLARRVAATAGAAVMPFLIVGYWVTAAWLAIELLLNGLPDGRERWLSYAFALSTVFLLGLFAWQARRPHQADSRARGPDEGAALAHPRSSADMPRSPARRRTEPSKPKGPMSQEAVLDGGPLGARFGMWVEPTHDGRWPPTVVWATDDGSAVKYRFRQMGFGGSDLARPVYEYAGRAEDATAGPE